MLSGIHFKWTDRSACSGCSGGHLMFLTYPSEALTKGRGGCTPVEFLYLGESLLGVSEATWFHFRV